MKQLNLVIESDSQPMYLTIARGIRKAIKQRQLRANEQLPSARMLAQQLSVNRHTIMAAFRELIAEGWIESRQRQGYFVMSELPLQGSITPDGVVVQSTPFHWRLVNQQELNTERSAPQCEFNFSGGCPDISLFNFKDFSGYLSQAMARPDIKSLNYGNLAGFAPFIEQVQVYLRRVRSLAGKKLITVNGSQEALYLLSRVLLQAGDKVAVEKLGYQPAWAAFRSSGAELIGIDQDDEGVSAEHFEQMAKDHQLRMLYLTPLHQYPTTVTLSVSRRLKIYRIAAKYQIPIIEDDYDHEFHYRCQPLAPMAADDPQGLVIYLSTFSKIMFPGIRIGFIAADEKLIEALIAYRHITNHKPNVLSQDAIARWMADGAFERHLRKLTRTYEKRRDFMVEQLQGLQQKGIELEYRIPDGGMAMWIKTALDAEQLAERAWRRGVFMQSENGFHLNSADSQNRYIRLGFAGMNEEKIEQGLNLIF